MALTATTIQEAEHNVRSALRDGGSLERLCQSFAEAIYKEFSESIVMIRTFAVLRLAQQSPNNVKFVRDIASTIDDAQLHDGSPIHTLLGTYGCEEAWRDRHRSKGHKAIPFLNQKTVSRIPMMSRLLNELGLAGLR